MHNFLFCLFLQPASNPPSVPKLYSGLEGLLRNLTIVPPNSSCCSDFIHSPYSSNNLSHLQLILYYLVIKQPFFFLYPLPHTPPELRPRIKRAARTLSYTNTRTGIARIWFGAGVTSHTVCYSVGVPAHKSLSPGFWMLSKCHTESWQQSAPGNCQWLRLVWPLLLAWAPYSRIIQEV